MQNTVKIVVVDPDPDIRMTLEYTLGKAGFEVVSAKNADEGLRRCLAERPTVLLTEVALPGVDGYELTGRIKGEPVTRHITHVILMTGHSQNEVFVKGPDVCADYYVGKPFNPAELIADLRLLIGAEFSPTPDQTSLLNIAKRIPSRREAITPGYGTDSKKVVRLNPPSIKFAKALEEESRQQVSDPHPGASQSASGRDDPRLAEVNKLLKSLAEPFRETQMRLDAVVRYLEKRTRESQETLY